MHESKTGTPFCSTMDCVLVASPEKDAGWDRFDLWDDGNEVPATGGDSPGQEMKSTSEGVLPDDCPPMLTEEPHFCRNV